MQILKIKTAILAFVLIVGIGMWANSHVTSAAQIASIPQPLDDGVLNEIAGYQQWQRVNENPLVVTLAVSDLQINTSAFSS